jgi:hypothetical protein
MNDLHSKRIGVETVPNRDIRIFHVNTEILPAASDRRYDHYNSEFDSKRRIGNPNRRLVNGLLAIEGIERVGLGRHEVSVEVGSVYFWKELEAKIIEKILRRLGWEKDEASIISMHDFLLYAERHDQPMILIDSAT